MAGGGENGIRNPCYPVEFDTLAIVPLSALHFLQLSSRNLNPPDSPKSPDGHINLTMCWQPGSLALTIAPGSKVAGAPVIVSRTNFRERRYHPRCGICSHTASGPSCRALGPVTNFAAWAELGRLSSLGLFNAGGGVICWGSGGGAERIFSQTPCGKVRAALEGGKSMALSSWEALRLRARPCLSSNWCSPGWLLTRMHPYVPHMGGGSAGTAGWPSRKRMYLGRTRGSKSPSSYLTSHR
eukprot:scaffold212963_cov30-Tisochrysis_lutea.AAC.1